MIQSSGTECHRYVPRHYLIPKYALLLTFFNSAVESVVTTDNCAGGTVQARFQVSTVLMLKFLVLRDLYAV